MTKYYRRAGAIFDDSIFGKWLNDIFEFLVTLWTGRESHGHPRPSLWVRRCMLIFFPLSYLVLGIAFIILFAVFFATAVVAVTAIGLINFYRRRWSD